jgi:hypothetical protein
MCLERIDLASTNGFDCGGNHTNGIVSNNNITLLNLEFIIIAARELRL